MKTTRMSFFAIAALAILSLVFFYGCVDTKPVPTGMANDGRAYRGASAPKLVIYEYSDFECPYCGAVQPTVEQVMRAYQDRVQLQFRHYPLPIHPDATPAAIASVCAENQGKFWEMHDKLYANQKALTDADFVKYATDIGLDVGDFNTCIVSSDAKAVVENDTANGVTAGGRGKPAIIIRQGKGGGSQPAEKIQPGVSAELARVG
jgi:protein-disulfide isomerase